MPRIRNIKQLTFFKPDRQEQCQRIFRVTKTILDGVGNNVGRPCLMFSLVGAQIIEHFYKKRARMMAGAAFYVVDGSDKEVLSFASFDADGQIK